MKAAYLLSVLFLGFSIGSRGESNQALPLVKGKNGLSRYNETEWEWQVIGPFASGMREQGADPLYPYYPNIESYDRFPSELADGGYVYPSSFFSSTPVKAPGTFTLGPVTFDQVRWQFNRDFYGWSLNQWQGWAWTQLEVASSATYLVNCINIGEFNIDGEEFIGDWYGYQSVYSSIFLTQGNHLLKVRLASAVRIFGGSIPPTVTFTCTFKLPSSSTLTVSESFQMVPDLVNGSLAGNLASFTAFNSLNRWISVVRVQALEQKGLIVSLLGNQAIDIAPGQSKVIPVQIELNGPVQCPLTVPVVLYTQEQTFSSSVTLRINCKSWGETYKFTFLDFDGSVHYASTRPPLLTCPKEGCPVLLALHGAGVEASSSFWTDSYSRQDYSWILFPTGRSTWGFDWHGPSRLNVENALQTLSTLPAVPQELKGSLAINLSKTFFAGHSNGGQGCWYWISHYPDRALAATPIAGYMKIQMYVPYFWRNGVNFADPFARGILESSISEYDIDLYASNMVGVPILARTGGSDDNVPPLHTRRLFRIINEWSQNPEAIQMSEVRGEGHWFDGIMNDEEMQLFIDNYTRPDSGAKITLPPFPSRFTVTTLNPGSSGHKGSIRILQLKIPYRLSRINVEASTKQWQITTGNVRRFSFSSDSRRNAEQIVVDGKWSFTSIQVEPLHYCYINSMWQVCSDNSWDSSERTPETYGPILQIYESPILIVVGSKGGDDFMKIAIKISNGISLYSSASPSIVYDRDFTSFPGTENYNIILIGSPEFNSVTLSLIDTLPVKFESSSSFQIGSKSFNSPGTGVLSLGPWKQKLSLLIAGTDVRGTQIASSSFPIQTGVTIPDFAVMDDEFKWKGSGGFLCAGYWDNYWKFDDATSFSC